MFFFCVQNLRPPLSTSCSPALNNLIRRCWSSNPAKRPDFTYIVSALEKYDECLKEGLPILVHKELNIKSSLRDIFRGCVPTGSSIPVYAWYAQISVSHNKMIVHVWFLYSIIMYTRFCNCKLILVNSRSVIFIILN